MTDDHATLVELATAGEPRAIESLVVHHLPHLQAFLRLRVGPGGGLRESVSDLAQSICADVLKDGADFEYRGEAAFRAWLYRRALFKLTERFRHNHRLKRDLGREVSAESARSAADSGSTLGYVTAFADLTTPSQHAMAAEASATLERAFDRLPERHREVITLHRICGLSHAQVGAELGITEGASRALLKRAMRALGLLMTDGPESASGEHDG